MFDEQLLMQRPIQYKHVFFTWKERRYATSFRNLLFYVSGGATIELILSKLILN